MVTANDVTNQSGFSKIYRLYNVSTAGHGSTGRWNKLPVPAKFSKAKLGDLLDSSFSLVANFVLNEGVPANAFVRYIKYKGKYFIQDPEKNLYLKEGTKIFCRKKSDRNSEEEFEDKYY